jgi:hypothetical protein
MLVICKKYIIIKYILFSIRRLCFYHCIILSVFVLSIKGFFDKGIILIKNLFIAEIGFYILKKCILSIKVLDF